jgi:Interferon-induced 6-16 family
MCLPTRRPGIVKGSQAARAMSVEAKQCGGMLPSVQHGGITASLQSIGAFGEVKPLPHEKVRKALHEAGIPTIGESEIGNGAEEELLPIVPPSYRQAASESLPSLIVDDHRCGGYNHIC